MNGGIYWKQFEKSGRVEDYLSYAVNGKQETAVSQMTDLGTAAGVGEYPYAGFYYGNGNGDKPDARGGI